MKTTIHGLLRMIKDGKTPKKIKYNDKIYEYFYDEKNYECFVIDHYSYLFDEDIIQILDKEVEILETKIPEILSTWFSVSETQSNKENIDYANYNFEKMYEKINEICDYLKNKSEE